MNHKDQFNFNILVEYYRVGDLDNGRVYLYDNIMVLVKKELMSNIDDMHHADIVQELYIKIDSRLIKSVKRGFGNKQIYAYVKLRTAGEIINYFKNEIGKNYIDTNYTSGDEEEGNAQEYTIDDLINFNQIPGLLLDGLHQCTELEMRLIMLHNYMEIPINKIEEITGYKRLNIYKRLKSGMKKLRAYLHEKGVEYEDLI